MSDVSIIQNLAHNLQRSSGRTRLSFKSIANRTAIDELYQQGCCKVRFPMRTDNSLEAVLLNTAGGLTDGDTIDNDFCWKAGSRGTVTTQAAERIYRAAGEDCARVSTRVRIEENCIACWLPQETIIFEGSRLARSLEIDMASDSRLLAIESTVFGRRAMGETVTTGRLSDRWRICLDGRLVFADSFLLDDGLAGPIDEHLGRPSVGDAATCLATIVVVAEDCDDAVGVVRAMETPPNARIGASCLGPITVVRILAPDSQIMRGIFGRMYTKLGRAFGMELPRVWHC